MGPDSRPPRAVLSTVGGGSGSPPGDWCVQGGVPGLGAVSLVGARVALPFHCEKAPWRETPLRTETPLRMPCTSTGPPSWLGGWAGETQRGRALCAGARGSRPHGTRSRPCVRVWTPSCSHAALGCVDLHLSSVSIKACGLILV